MYQDQNENLYARESHKDTALKVYECTNKGTQLTCIDTTENIDQQSIVSQFESIHQQEERYRELRADLKKDEKLPDDPPESFEQLLIDQPE